MHRIRVTLTVLALASFAGGCELLFPAFSTIEPVDAGGGTSSSSGDSSSMGGSSAMGSSGMASSAGSSTSTASSMVASSSAATSGTASSAGSSSSAVTSGSSSATSAATSGSMSGSSSGGVVLSPTNTVIEVLNPGDLPADGVMAYTVRVTVKSDADVVVPNVMVRLQPTGDGNILNPAQALSQGNGRAVFTLAASRAGTRTVNAVLDPDGANVMVQNAPQVTFVGGAADALRFAVQPQAEVTAGAPLSPALEVQVVDANGNDVAPASPVNVTLTLGGGSAGAVLGGTASAMTNASGRATFNNVFINLAGTGYVLSASAGALLGSSNNFNVTHGTAASLAFVQQPTGVTVNRPISPAVTVAIRDGLGNTVTSATTAVTLVKAGSSAGTLSGTLTRNAVAGVATFDDLVIDTTGQNHALSASATGLQGTTSNTFGVFTAGQAVAWVITSAPAGNSVAAGATFQVEAEARDSEMQRDTNVVRDVTVSLQDANGAVLLGSTTVASSGGRVTFTGLSIQRAGPVTLRISDGTLTDATRAVTVTPLAAEKLVLESGPSSTVTAGAQFNVVVHALDMFDNVDTAYVDTVSISGPVITGTTMVSAVAGVATFSNVSVRLVGTAYVISAAATGLTGAMSSMFNVVPANAARIDLSGPAGGTAGVASTFTVTLFDAFDNRATSFAGNVRLDVDDAASTTATLVFGAGDMGQKTQGLRVDVAGTYDVSAAGSGVVLTGDIIMDYVVSPAAAASLEIASQPTEGDVNVALSPLVVRAEDAFGNLATGFTGMVVLAVTQPTTMPPALTGGSVSAVMGTATFNAATVNGPASGLVLRADATGLTSASTMPFPVYNPNQAPVVTVPPMASTNEDTFLALADVMVTDPDNGTDPVRVTVTAGSGTLNATVTTGTSNLSGQNSAMLMFDAPVGAMATVFSGLRFTPAQDASGTVMITVAADDLARAGTARMPGLTDSDSFMVTVSAVNDAPVITDTQATVTFTEGDTGVALAGAATVSDVDSTRMSALKVLTPGTWLAEDAVSLVPGNGVAVAGMDVSVDGTVVGMLQAAATGEAFAMTLNADASLVRVTTLVRQLRYTNSGADVPTAGARALTLSITDDMLASGTAALTVNVVAVNDAPVVTVPGAAVDADEDDMAFLLPGVSVADADHGALQVTVSLTGPGRLRLGTLTGVMANVSEDADFATATLLGTFAALNTALGDLTFVPTPNLSGTATITVAASDLAMPTPGTDSETFDVVLAPVPDNPVLAAGIVSMVGTYPRLILPNGTITDADNPATLDADAQIQAAFTDSVEPTDELTVVTSGSVTVTGANITIGGTQVASFTGGVPGTPLVITFTTNATLANAEAVLRAIQLGVTVGVMAPRTVSVFFRDETSLQSNILTPSYSGM